MSSFKASRSSFPGSPKLLRGGLVQLDPSTKAIIDVIVFQYNPDTVTRTLQPRAMTGEPGDRLEVLRLTGPPHETIKLEAELDAADQLECPNERPVQEREGRPRLLTRAGPFGQSPAQGLRIAFSAPTGRCIEPSGCGRSVWVRSRRPPAARAPIVPVGIRVSRDVVRPGGAFRVGGPSASPSVTQSDLRHRLVRHAGAARLGPGRHRVVLGRTGAGVADPARPPDVTPRCVGFRRARV